MFYEMSCVFILDLDPRALARGHKTYKAFYETLYEILTFTAKVISKTHYEDFALRNTFKYQAM